MDECSFRMSLRPHLTRSVTRGQVSRSVARRASGNPSPKRSSPRASPGCPGTNRRCVPQSLLYDERASSLHLGRASYFFLPPFLTGFFAAAFLAGFFAAAFLAGFFVAFLAAFAAVFLRRCPPMARFARATSPSLSR